MGMDHPEFFSRQPGELHVHDGGCERLRETAQKHLTLQRILTGARFVGCVMFSFHKTVAFCVASREPLQGLRAGALLELQRSSGFQFNAAIADHCAYINRNWQYDYT